jgi:hypothetical protein
MKEEIKQLQEKAREELKREFELTENLDKHFWQKGYPKLKNQLGRKIDSLIEQTYKQAKQEIVEEINEIMDSWGDKYSSMKEFDVLEDLEKLKQTLNK